MLMKNLSKVLGDQLLDKLLESIPLNRDVAIIICDYTFDCWIDIYTTAAINVTHKLKNGELNGCFKFENLPWNEKSYMTLTCTLSDRKRENTARDDFILTKNTNSQMMIDQILYRIRYIWFVFDVSETEVHDFWCKVEKQWLQVICRNLNL
jgi:hypothetical protein